MIKSFSIENFKVFSTKVDLKFAPITLIYGPNSSGKSSIIQSILVLKESLLKPNKTYSLRSNNDFFQLGGYTSVVNDHDTTKDIHLSFEDDLVGYEFTYKSINKNNIKSSYLSNIFVQDMNNDNKKYNYSKADVESRDFNNHYDLNIDYDAFKYYVDKGFSNSKFDFFSKRYNFENSNNKDLEKIFNKVKTERFLKKDHKIFPSISVDRRKIINKNFNINDIETLFIEVFKRLIDDDLSKKEFVLTEKLERISYVGPLRPHPKRMYALNNNNTNSVGVTGENFLNFLTYDEKYLDLVNKVLVDFGIKYKIELQRNDNDVVGDTVSVLLRHRSNNLITTLVDVGFGIGQLLPILIEGLVKRKSTICIEQPEIHLHPKLQADLATFFAKDILSDKGNQWIIETHSEALLLRFQRLIRHKILKPEDISIIYIDPQDEGVKTLHIPLDDEGDFTIEWPYGFFEERIEEIFGGNPLKDGN